MIFHLVSLIFQLDKLFSIYFIAFLLYWWKFSQLINFTSSWKLFLLHIEFYVDRFPFFPPFCQHSKDVNVLSFGLFCFWWKVNYYLYLLPLWTKEICFFHCWLLLTFPLYLRFLAFLLLMCFCLYFQYLEYSELLSELLKFIFLSKFGKYSDIVSSNIFSAPFFYPFMTLITHKLECLIL